MIKQIVSTLSSIAVVLGGLIAVPAASANSLCDLPGSGSSSMDPYLISNQQELQNYDLCDSSSTHVKITNDIEISGEWRPYDLEGSLNGGGFTISGLRSLSAIVPGGLFDTVSGYVMNLKIDDFIISSPGPAGTLAASADSAYVVQVEITNSIVNGTAAGGMFGEVSGLTEILFNSVYNVDVAGGDFAGGLVGQALFDGGSRMWFNHVVAEVSGNQSMSSGVAGGLIGRISIETVGAVEIKFSGFNGVVQTSAPESISPIVGGLVGEVSQSPSIALGGAILGLSQVFTNAVLRGNFNTQQPPAGFVAERSNGVLVFLEYAWTSFDAQRPTVPHDFNVAVADSTSNAHVFFENDRSNDTVIDGSVTGIAGRSASQLRDIATYAAWNIDSSLGFLPPLWVIDPDVNDGYPLQSSLYDLLTNNLVDLGNQTCDLRGSGDVASPYLVGTKYELKEATTDCLPAGSAPNFQQVQDISLSGEIWQSMPLVATGVDPVVFNGDGHRISELVISESTSGSYGLFSTIQNAEVRDMRIFIEELYCSDSCVAGALAGQIEDASINQIAVAALSPLLVEKNSALAGVLGLLAGEVLESSLSELILLNESGYYGLSAETVGGVAGRIFNSTLNQVNVFSGLLGSNYAGGLAGLFGISADTAISSLDFNGTIDSAGAFGALFGEVITGATDPLVLEITNLYMAGQVTTPINLPVSAIYQVSGGIQTEYQYVVDDVDFFYFNGLLNVPISDTDLQASGAVVSSDVIRGPVTDPAQLTGWSVAYDEDVQGGLSNLATVDANEFAWVFQDQSSPVGPMFVQSQIWNAGFFYGIGYSMGDPQFNLSANGLSVQYRADDFSFFFRASLYAISFTEDSTPPGPQRFAVLKRSEAQGSITGLFDQIQPETDYDVISVALFPISTESLFDIRFGTYRSPALCEEGSFSDSGFAPCNLAPAGTYVDTTGATAPINCPAGTDSDEGATECFVPSESPAPYLGPIITTIAGQQVERGSQLVIRGERLVGVSSVSLGGFELQILSTSSSLITAVIPIDAALGAQDLEIVSGFGALRIASFAVVIENAESSQSEDSSQPVVSIKRIGDTVRVFAKDVVGNGKVQFKVNGREVAWIRAVDNSDPKLFFANDTYYLVRRIDLKEGKNAFEIYVEGERVRRVAYTR